MTSDPKESEILSGVLSLCQAHPLVKRAWRVNSGAARLKGFYVRFGQEGHSDVQGFMKDGKFLAIEVKRPKERATKSQELFLQDVKESGGKAGIARSVADAKAIIEAGVPRETMLFQGLSANLQDAHVRKLKDWCRKEARKGVNRGILTPQLCERCHHSQIKTEMHHEDYTKPLEVHWLCRSCHRLEHGYNTWLA